MSIEGQTQVAQRAVFSWHRFDNLLVEVAAGFFAIQRQPVANLDPALLPMTGAYAAGVPAL